MHRFIATGFGLPYKGPALICGAAPFCPRKNLALKRKRDAKAPLSRGIF
ncbi:hypothetical protein Z947_3713 [Sulfitobacter geojensis]|nr:hypothetical protein Z947_3713 [Sulfitobacter geojensis]